MKFLTDENIAPRVVTALRGEGFDVLTVSEAKFSSAPDEKVLTLAVKQKRVILTHDKDFGSLLHQLQPPPCGVILLRLRNQSSRNVVKHLIPFLKKIQPEKVKNKLVVFQEGKVRII
ncbi:MAG: DUF5615 family PIN-like protein [Parcubacteria group bacterium]|nr:DUF5615 family PIN-like protein [Parcubacteria group bacterium]